MSNKESDKENQNRSGIRIVDRRRFDSAGEEKAESVAGAKDVTQEPAPKAQTLNQEALPNQDPTLEQDITDFTMSDPESSDADAEEESPISFGSFVLSLATQALMQLGQLPAPDGVAIPVDPGAAQQTIEVLAMLQAKTKGNLDAKEEGLLRDALHSLKVAFLRSR